MEKLEEELNKCLNKKAPFVFYRKPNSDKVKAIIQKEVSVNYTSDLSTAGFVFAPFDNIERSYMIRREKSVNLSFSYKWAQNKQTIKEIQSAKSIQKEIHIDLVQKAIHFINNSGTEKIVISRKEILEIENIDIFIVPGILKLIFQLVHVPVFLKVG